MEYEEEPVLPCNDKLVFDTKKQAQAATVVVDWQHGTKVHPYKCRYCHLWHVSSAHAN